MSGAWGRATAHRGRPCLEAVGLGPIPTQLSFTEVLAVSLINEALSQGSPEKTLSALLLPAAGLDGVRLPVAARYHLLLVAAKRQKAQVRRWLTRSVPRAGRTSPWAGLHPREPQPGRHCPFWALRQLGF